MRNRIRNCFTALSVLAVCATPALATEPVHKKTFVGAGEYIDHFKVNIFGRYSLQAHSKQGVSIQLVEKIAGISAVHGNPGKRNGRMDTFLDVGEYRLVAKAHKKATEPFTLAVRPFTELNADKAEQLLEYKLVSSTLQDYQQRSYWLRIPETRLVNLEAAGRSLADMRLWKNGQWLVAGKPKREKLTPKEGEPLTGLRLVKKLEAGLYLLTLYGGEALPWAESDTATHPVHLRWGIPKLTSADRRQYIASPFGIDRFRVSGKVDHVRVELPKIGTLQVEAGRYSKWTPFRARSGRRSGELTKKSRELAVQLRLKKRKNDDVIIVRREAGQPYIMEHFYYGWNWTIPVTENGPHWITSIQGGDLNDTLGATAILTKKHWKYTRNLTAYVDGMTFKMAADTNWRRKFNLLEHGELHLEVVEAGRYTFQAHNDIKPQLSVVPFVEHYSNLQVKSVDIELGKPIDLARGYYLLSISPARENKGIADLQITGSRPAATPSTMNTRVQFNSVVLDKGYAYRLSTNRQPGVVSGLMVRKLPLALEEEAMPLNVQAGETLLVPITLKELSVIEAIDTYQKPLAIGVRPATWPQTDVVWKDRYVLPAGTHNVMVKNAGERATLASLRIVQPALQAGTDLPVLDSWVFQGMPKFTQLAPNVPYFMVLGKKESKTFALNVTKPGLYSLETSGLLRTQGTIRSRAVVSIASESENGVGRNFLVQQFLRPGTYQVTVSTRGDSVGRLGLVLKQTDVVKGGSLQPDTLARTTLKPGVGVIYDVMIDTPELYYFFALTQNKLLDATVLDENDWPVHTKYARHGYNLQKGRYQVLFNPPEVEQRVVLHVQKTKYEKEYAGVGPHKIKYEGRGIHVNNTWYEPKEGQARKPHQWHFMVPADISMTVQLSGEGMVADLLKKQGNSWEKVGVATQTTSLNAKVTKGEYQVAVRSYRKNNKVDYRLHLSSSYYVPGTPSWLRHADQQTAHSATDKIFIATGDEGLLQVESYGMGDVYAKLYRIGEPNVLASSDDRENDWNFLIAQNVPAGNYVVEMKAIGASKSKQVGVTLLQTKGGKALGFPAERRIAAGEQVVTPLTLGSLAANQLHVLTASSTNRVGIAIEKQVGETWQTLGQDRGLTPWLALTAVEGSKYRLRVWPLDDSASPVTVKSHIVKTDATTEAALTTGLTGGVQLTDNVRAYHVDVKAAGVFALQNRGTNELRWNRGEVLQSLPNGGENIVVPQSSLWLVQRGDDAVQAQRVRVSGASVKNPLQVVAQPNERITVDLDTEQAGIRLITVESRLGQPSMAMQGIGWEISSATGVADKSLAAVAQSPVSAQLVVGTSSDVALPITIQQRSFQLGQRESLSHGVYDRSLAANAAHSFTFPKDSRVQVVLPAQSAAVFRRFGMAVATVWSGAKAQAFDLEETVDDVVVVQAHPTAQSITLSVKANAGDVAFTEEQAFKRYFATAGTSVIPVNITTQRQLMVAGEGVNARFVGNSGRVKTGTSFIVNEPGTVWIEHGVGFAMAWLNDLSKPVGVKATTLAQVNSLGGKQQRFTTRLAEPSLVQLRSAQPAVVMLTKASGEREMTVFNAGINLQTYAPAGDLSVVVMSLNDNALAGQLQFAATNATTLTEGQGPAIRLAPGGARLFKFVNTRKASLGMGVTASADVVGTRLYNAAGKVLGNGVVQMHELEKGEYYMMVNVPADGEVVEARPAVVNVKDRGDGPPAEVLKQYLPKPAN